MAEIVTISDGALSAAVDPMGAQLMSLSLDGGEYLWQGDERFWPRRAPVLFPIVGCLRNDSAQSAQGPVRLKRHGIARLYEHRVVSRDEKSVTFELASTDETRAAYPFDFTLNMTYALEGGALAQTFAVTNTGSVDLPFTLGGHPAFNVPAPGDEGASFSDYRLEFARPWTAVVPTIDEAGLHDFSVTHELTRDSDVLPLTHELFERLLTVVLVDVPERRVRLVGPAGHGVELAFDGFEYLGVWTASAEAPFVAIEPWVGCATAYDESDVFEEKRGTITLAPGERCEKTFLVRPF
ncbi:aldose 1-epimerase family protein [Olsenella profusa]|uniref:Aldose 1-epimerase family protein n=1 Tax=Olsenella profusa TaxID=138595 RepID=A0ABS2EZQ4_9ACTN|nr:aldose 1-epimerase family protein [Olsenella profusa]MBM6774058.1 aldose 1-epimerase family protein [Olsenella profusa]